MNYPHPLPDVDGWRSQEVCAAASKAIAEGWEYLPAVADALEAAGCDDPVILSHLRDQDHTKCRAPWRRGGCFEDECWLLNLILEKAQPVAAIFKEKLGGGDEVEVRAPVINPGGWWGKTWQIFVADCMDPPRYIVEADTMQDVIDEFIESDHGKSERLDPDDKFHNQDYGFEVRKGDTIFGVTVEEDGWLDLQGNPVDGEGRSEPSIADGGILYDGDNIQIRGRESYRSQTDFMPFPVTYHGPGLPPEGISPLVYHLRGECRTCGVDCFPIDGGKCGDNYCSKECHDEDRGGRGFDVEGKDALEPAAEVS